MTEIMSLRSLSRSACMPTNMDMHCKTFFFSSAPLLDLSNVELPNATVAMQDCVPENFTCHYPAMCFSRRSVAASAVRRTRRKQIVKGAEGLPGGNLTQGVRGERRRTHFCRFRSFNGNGAPRNLFVSLVPRYSRCSLRRISLAGFCRF